MNAISGVDFDEAYDNKVEGDVDGLKIFRIEQESTHDVDYIDYH